MSKLVTFARLHQGVHIPGLGEIGNVFPPQSKTFDSLTMEATPLGLDVNFVYQGRRQALLIPLAAIMVMAVVPETLPPSGAKALKAVG